MNSDRHISEVLDALRITVIVALAVVATIFVFVAAPTLWAASLIVGKVLGIVVLGVIAWASWTGYFQNRGKNDEWPLNVVFFLLSVSGVVGLIATMVWG